MTTSRQLYEATLIELNKENAPNLLLEDFNYFANKAIYQYTNKRYNIYDVSQQTTDDLRVLKATALLTPKKTYSKYQSSTDSEFIQVGDNPTLEDLVEIEPLNVWMLINPSADTAASFVNKLVHTSLS